MNVSDLRYFVRVCDDHSISQAAEHFFMTPQGISKAIRRMEEEVGTDLLLRSQSGVQMTPYGQIFYEHAVRILQEWDHAQQEIDSLKAQNLGLLKLVSAYGILRYLTPSFIHAFTDSNPSVHLDYTEFPDSYVEQKVLDGEYDIGLSPVKTQNPELSYLPLFQKEIFFVVHPGSRFYSRQEVSIREVLAEPFVMENDHFLIHHLLSDTAAGEGVTIIPYFSTSGFSLCYKLCEKGEANTASMAFIFEDMAQGSIRMIPFTEHPMWPVALIHKKNVPLSVSMRAFIAHTTAWKETLQSDV